MFDGYGMQLQDKDKSYTKNVIVDEENLIGDVNGVLGKRLNETFQPYMIQFMCKQQEFKSEKVQKEDEREDLSRFEYHFYKNDSKFKLEEPKEYRSPQTMELRMTAAHQPNMGQHDNIDFDNKNSSDAEQQFKMEQSIFKYVRTMQDLLADSNLKRTEIDRESAEALIEKDFLKKPRYQ